MTETPRPEAQVSYGRLAQVFLRLSVSAFGGPVAHIAMAEDELVRRRKWLTREHYLDLIAATNLIPGPNSTEVMIHVGYTLRGIPGAIFTGACFILPSALITLVLAMLYVSSGSLPEVAAALWGIKPVVVAIIASAGYRLLRTALRTADLWVLFAASVAALVLLNIPEVLAMLGAGVVYAVYKSPHLRMTAAAFALMLYPVQQEIIEGARAGVGDLFFYFLRIGAVLFGSGYVLIAYIQQDLVNNFGWLSARELLDAIAIGQTTPGPVSTTATTVGYIVAGLPGAVMATLGIFLPSFVFVILSAPFIPRMRRSVFMSNFLSGVNAGVIAAILLTLVDLAGAAFRTPDGAALSPVTLVLGAVALIALLRFRLNATWLIALGGVAGLLLGSGGG